MSAWRWWVALIPAAWLAGVWVIRLCRFNAQTIREQREQALYDRVFTSIVAQLRSEERS